jgi:HAD superfamily phosphatase (TIGR01668 family)
MFKKHIPFAYAQNIYEISLDFFKSHNLKYIFLDLDNTLDSYKSYTPNDRATKLINTFIQNGIEPIIFSNNKGYRVGCYANYLKVRFHPSTMKPFSFKLIKFMEENNIKPEEVMMVGDQLMTDVRAANGAKIRCIYCEKLVKEDQFTTHFNRILEFFVKKYHMKKGNLIDWREKYGKSN